MSTPASTLRRRLWLCLEITRHRRLSARRNPSFRQNQAAKVFFALGAAVSILYLVFLSVILAITVGQGMPYSAAGVICGFSPYILVADILFRLMLQNPPALLVKPYLLLPIPRRACIDAFVGASGLSGGNLVTQALVTPYVIMTVVFTAGVLPALMLIVFFWLFFFGIFFGGTDVLASYDDIAFGSNFHLDRVARLENLNGYFFVLATAWKVGIVDCLDVCVDFAIEHINNASCVSSKGRVVSNHDDGVAERVNLLEFFHDNMAVATIEVTGRLVGENDAWISNQATGDSNALLLATG